MIDRQVYTSQEPFPDPDFAKIILKPMVLMERGPFKKRDFDSTVGSVATFSKGIAA
ncbi:MAG: Type restriction enzyme protein [Verrucomicrobiota bacterium]